MDEYIDRDELLKELCTISAPTPSESWIVEKCIEKVNEQPTADVVPKSEYDNLKMQFDALDCECDRLEKTEYEKHDKIIEAKTEVAREIFEEIEKALDGELIWHKVAPIKKKYTEDHK